MPTSVIPNWTGDRNWLGAFANSNAARALASPWFVLCCNRAFRAETTAISAMANSPFTKINSSTNTNSNARAYMLQDLIGVAEVARDPQEKPSQRNQEIYNDQRNVYQFPRHGISKPVCDHGNQFTPSPRQTLNAGWMCKPPL